MNLSRSPCNLEREL